MAADARYYLAISHRDGVGKPRDIPEARKLLALNAAEGHAQSQYDLAMLHDEGVGAPPDLAEARRLYGLAAAQHHPEALCNLGLMHQHGQGGKKDLEEAMRLYSEAILLGKTQAMTNAGGICLQVALLAAKAGDTAVADQQFLEATRLFHDACTTPPADSNAAVMLAKMQMNGWGGPKDTASAQNLLAAAAAMGNPQAEQLLAGLQETTAPDDLSRLLPLGLAKGRRVTITGLAARPELNGQLGVVRAWNQAKGRAAVELHDGTRVGVKPANLVLVEEN